jgi:hypothetical protein
VDGEVFSTMAIGYRSSKMICNQGVSLYALPMRELTQAYGRQTVLYNTVALEGSSAVMPGL